MFHNYNTSLEAVDKLNYNFFSLLFFAMNEIFIINDLYVSRSTRTDFIMENRNKNHKNSKSWPLFLIYGTKRFH
jgi:hypothetical protein